MFVLFYVLPRRKNLQNWKLSKLFAFQLIMYFQNKKLQLMKQAWFCLDSFRIIGCLIPLVRIWNGWGYLGVNQGAIITLLNCSQSLDRSWIHHAKENVSYYSTLELTTSCECRSPLTRKHKHFPLSSIYVSFRLPKLA